MNNEPVSRGAQIYLDPNECGAIKDLLRKEGTSWALALIEHIEECECEKRQELEL